MLNSKLKFLVLILNTLHLLCSLLSPQNKSIQDVSQCEPISASFMPAEFALFKRVDIIKLTTRMAIRLEINEFKCLGILQ